MSILKACFGGSEVLQIILNLTKQCINVERVQGNCSAIHSWQIIFKKFPNDNSIKKTFLLTPMNRKPDWSIRRMEKRESKQEKQKDARRLLHCHWMIISLKSKGSFNKNWSWVFEICFLTCHGSWYSLGIPKNWLLPIFLFDQVIAGSEHHQFTESENILFSFRSL